MLKKKAITQMSVDSFFPNRHTGSSNHAEHFHPAKICLILMGFEIFVKKLLLDPSVLFLEMAAMFFD